MLPDQKGKGHILVVEPNDITRKLIVGILNAQGYDTWEAAGGDEATVFLGKHPALVIVDVDGEDPDVMGFLHKMSLHHARLSMVAVTHSDDMDLVKARIGIHDLSILQKPVMPDKLLTNIQRHLIKGVEEEMTPAAVTQDNPHVPEDQQKHETFMSRAIDLAQEKMDEGHGGPFAAVVVKNGQIIGEGWDDVLGAQDPTAHAEIMALRKAAEHLGDYTLSGCSLYTVCEPCPMCLAAVYAAKIDRIFYANTYEDADKIGFDHVYIHHEVAAPEDKRALPSRMLMRGEAQIVFDNWMKKPDKISY